ncbi:MAG: hypothetical protein ACI9VR_003085 [Cognaticolwellia sp.]
MSKFLKALARLNLVQLDEEESSRPSPHDGDEDIDKILAETRALMGHTDDLSVDPAGTDGGQAAPEPAPPPISVPSEINEGQAFEEIYAAAGIADSPYPAEQMLKLLDGLKAMGPRERKIAVMAMDAADDRWTISDPVLDAQRKIATLQTETERLGAFKDQAEAQAEADLQAQETYKTEASSTIRQQISELEELLEQELRKVADEKAGIHVRLEAARSAVVREKARYEQHIDTLYVLSKTFENTPTEQS